MWIETREHVNSGGTLTKATSFTPKMDSIIELESDLELEMELELWFNSVK